MSQASLIPEGTTNQEAEHGKMHQRPPLPFVPRNFGIVEAGEYKPTTKVPCDGGVEEKVPLFDGTTEEEYVHVMDTYEGLLRKTGHRSKYDRHAETKKQVEDKLLTHEEINKPAAADEDVLTDDSDAEEEQAASNDDESGEQQPRQITKKKKYQKGKKKLEKLLVSLDKVMQKRVDAAFALFEQILAEEPSERWRSIVVDVCDAESWLDDEGEEQEGARGQTWATLALCKREFMLIVFKKDAAEQQHIYLQFHVRMPKKMTLRNFVRCLQILSRNTQFLPCLKDCSFENRALERMSRPLTDYELCSIVMRRIPQEWVDFYYSTGTGEVPTKMDRLLPKLESIEQLDSTKKRSAEVDASRAAKKAKKDKGNGDGGYRIPKKKQGGSKKPPAAAAASGEQCRHCKANGGAHTTHPTHECKKYDKHGKLRSDWKGYRGPSKNSSAGDSHTFLQLYEENKKLSKKLSASKKKKSSRKKRRRYDSESSDSEDSY